jgi:hypothetical protein
MKEDPSSAVQSENRRLAAIMFTDIVGFSRQMGSNEARTLRLLDLHNQLIQRAVGEHHGTVIKTVGDAFLVDFPSVVHAVQCAQQIQVQLRAHNSEKESPEQIHVRIGIHLGDIVQIYALLPEAPQSVRQKLQVQRLKLSRRVGVAPRMVMGVLALIAVTAVVVRHLSLSTPSP